MKLKIKYLFILFLAITILFIFYSTSFANNKIEVSSPSAILIDSKSGKIIYDKNSSGRLYPASTTKVMTAILVVENCNLTDIATVSKNAVSKSSVPDGYTTADLVEGERLSIENLLYALMLPSANDAAIVLAEHVSGSVEKFAERMNTKAKEIGCKDTHFVNPNGVHDNNHYSTAYDLALIGQYAMKNETIRNIVKKTSFTLPKTNKYNKDDREFENTNRLIEKGNYFYKFANGLKTGYTEHSGACIIASAENENNSFISVILGAKDFNARENDCIELFDYGFKNYSEKTFLKKSETIKQVEITVDNKKEPLDIIAEKEIKLFTTTNINDVEPKIELNDNIKSPVLKGFILGKISYSIDGVTYTSNLLAGNSVVDSNTMQTFYTILLTGVIILILMSIFKINNHRKRKNGLIKFYR